MEKKARTGQCQSRGKADGVWMRSEIIGQLTEQKYPANMQAVTPPSVPHCTAIFPSVVDSQ
jgi:hypothetical protein